MQDPFVITAEGAHCSGGSCRSWSIRYIKAVSRVLVLLLEQAGGEAWRGVYLLPVFGEDHSHPLVPAKLEAWPSAISF